MIHGVHLQREKLPSFAQSMTSYEDVMLETNPTTLPLGLLKTKPAKLFVFFLCFRYFVENTTVRQNLDRVLFSPQIYYLRYANLSFLFCFAFAQWAGISPGGVFLV